MREIKFRAWDDHHNKIIHLMDLPNNWHSDNLALVCQFPRNIHIMQYTGLKDKNGVEIYEGDVIRVNDKFTHGNNVSALVVSYTNEGTAGFSPFIDQFDYEGMTFFDCFTDFEVIGNIYENPTLLTDSP